MSKTKRRIFQLMITLVLLAVGIVGFNKLKASKPQIQKRRAETPVPAVRALKLQTGRRNIVIQGEGTVSPLREINLVPQVGGKVIRISPSLVNGGEFKKDQILLKIDPVDYQLAVTLALAKIKNSESLLKLAKEEAAAAKEEWGLLYENETEGGAEPPPLVAKEPQLAAAQARLEADRADLRKARLNLERTELKAPFDGRVSQEKVDVGQFVSPGQVLADLYSTEAAEIIIPLADAELLWFHVPGFTPGNGPGSKAMVKARIAGQAMTWHGRVVRTEGRLDERTRMINVVVRVERPYEKKPPLALGLFVSVDILGRELSDAVLIPRSALRRDDTVWIVDREGLLNFRKVQVARAQGDHVLIRSGLRNGELLVVSKLQAVTDGMSVRTMIIKEGPES
jgi:RND family efflux transporter MFP subunit